MIKYRQYKIFRLFVNLIAIIVIGNLTMKISLFDRVYASQRDTSQLPKSFQSFSSTTEPPQENPDEAPTDNGPIITPTPPSTFDPEEDNVESSSEQPSESQTETSSDSSTSETSSESTSDHTEDPTSIPSSTQPDVESTNTTIHSSEPGSLVAITSDQLPIDYMLSAIVSGIQEQIYFIEDQYYLYTFIIRQLTILTNNHVLNIVDLHLFNWLEASLLYINQNFSSY
ncbi:hypothetical protein HZY91_06760 [Facklamia sp. DSM 111018]|uniref:Uncharacterized protein n=1 Tax=Facklamia lactis TaxID=2749967 RepID=A0ABS0LTB5_9LACT|nr:hypothetical protein [Facklamia lactis]MBG9980782.1 hypothetical protein [Facklamia lactis]MBG9986596.1 hypothetical protein [Facklamia lactis]